MVSHPPPTMSLDPLVVSPAPSLAATATRLPSPVQDHGEPVRQHTVQAMEKPGVGSGHMHRHTASIASLIRADERSEGWSPIGNKGFVFPPVSR
ncbi:hypothetical protein L210DRAFT_3543240 [Boletus edulis BED1]|uniref:Uncharacterized protein n=1 Tax=Boletus edulis BED1 TaxID=1328754 RepID=A0AAD4BT01_BOLED|nr:hypothetical protein L210DRAFT_3543240 [Boletus edulis BED1]